MANVPVKVRKARKARKARKVEFKFIVKETGWLFW